MLDKVFDGVDEVNHCNIRNGKVSYKVKCSNVRSLCSIYNHSPFVKEIDKSTYDRL